MRYHRCKQAGTGWAKVSQLKKEWNLLSTAEATAYNDDNKNDKFKRATLA